MPVVIAAGLFALYLVVGFFALPALVKWQLEKQVAEKLGHRLSIAELRFNPLAFTLEAGDVLLSDPGGGALVGFKRLQADFELRSAIDRAWSFAQVTLEAPFLRVEFDEDGRHNFSALLERAGSTGPGTEPEEEAGALPRLAVKRIEVTAGRIEFSDRLLKEPLVAHIEPLRIEIDDLSTLPAQQGRYRVAARTTAGETFEASGELALNPIASKGRLALTGIQARTLAGGASRMVVLDSPAGSLDLAAGFELAVDGSGALTGSVHDIGLDVASLSFSAPGSTQPLAAFETLSLKPGRIDLARREASFAGLRIAKGSIAASSDPQGRLDWTKLVRTAEPASRQAEAASSPADAWRISVASVELEDIAVRYSDAANGQHAKIAALAAAMSARAELGTAGARVELDKPKLSLAGARLERAGESFDTPAVILEAGRATVAAAQGRLEAALDAPHLAAPKGLSARRSDATLELGSLAVRSGRATLDGANASVDDPQIALTGISLSAAANSARLSKLTVAGQRLALKSGADRLELALDAPRLAAPEGVVARRGDATLELASLSVRSGRVALDGADASIDDPQIALTGISLGNAAQRARLRELSMQSGRVALRSGPSGLELELDKPRSTLAELQMERGAETAGLQGASVAGEKLSLAQADGRLRVSGGAARITLAGLEARRGSEQVALQDASFEAQTVSFEDAVLRLASFAIEARGAASGIGSVAGAEFGAKSLALALPEGPIDLTGEGLRAALADVVLRSPAEAGELLRLGNARLSGGALRLQDRVFTAEEVALAGGKAQVALDAQGKLNWSGLLGGAAEAPAAQAPAAAWRLALKSAALEGFALGFEDRREASPAFSAGLEAIQARISGLDTGSATPMQVELQASVASGGEIRASGSVRADDVRSDLQVRIQAIALAPAQGYLSEFAELRLASGTLSAEGRLRYGDTAGAGAQLAYEGKVALERLLLEELKSARPFLSWDSVASGDVTLTLAPNQADIGELRLDGPAGRLIIAEDQSVNLMDVLKEKPKSEPAATGDPFPVTVARIRVSGGTLEFADLSLRPQFGTRMHELKGVVSGVGTDPEGSAKLQLDARVDQYGSAKIRGQISVLDPEKLTDIDVAFRNLEMTSLSPYIVKFAGYRIDGGRLALDLQYKVSDAKLRGENKIVLNQVELGEKVESPGALDLPLELALAILKDSEGVIDIELPVSGDLDDPKFDYGAVIGKAFGNLIGGIATAPFRALGALLGAGGKPLDTVHFEPGDDSIAPPERQKLETLARALKERPALMLVVPPAYAAEQDRSALKSLAVRTDMVKHMGVELAPGEDPGPIDTANPRAQRAVEATFSQRYAPEVLAALKRRAFEGAAPGVKQLPPAFYQGLVDRLIEQQPVTEPMLAQLAARRGKAILHELTSVAGVPAAQVMLAEPRATSDAGDKAVTLRLELELAK